jgi:hypothetical protein
MKKVLAVLAALAAFGFVSCATGGLSTFGAEMGKTSVAGRTVRAPYTSLTSYYGYVKPGAQPDGTENGRNMYYVYIWVPVVAPEIGVRMISPVPQGMEPKEGDFKSPLWDEGKTDTEHFFDTWITLQRADGVLAPADFAKAASGTWTSYGSNDDSSEMPKNPRGSAYNSLLRVVSEPSNPAKALVRGLYRVGFTTYKRGDVVGTFLAQVGAPIAIPGIVVASSISEIQAQATQ